MARMQTTISTESSIVDENTYFENFVEKFVLKGTPDNKS